MRATSVILFTSCSVVTALAEVDLLAELQALKAELADVKSKLGALEVQQQAQDDWKFYVSKQLDECGCNGTSDRVPRPTDFSIDGADSGKASDGQKEHGKDHEDADSSSWLDQQTHDESSEKFANSGNVLNVRLQDEEWVKEIFFGGKPWIVHCLDSRSTVSQEVPEVFRQSAFHYRANATFGTLACWERLPSSKKSLASRFGLPKPPLTFVVSNGDPPVPLDLHRVVKPWQFMRKVAPHLRVKVSRMDGIARFNAFCSKRKACLVVGFRTEKALATTTSILLPALEDFRKVRAVAVDMTKWRLRVDERLLSSKPVAGSDQADLLCLVRNTATSKRAGAFLKPLSNSNIAKEIIRVNEFLRQCYDGKGLISASEVPRISQRDTPSGTTKPPTGTSKGRTTKTQRESGKRDYVGRRGGTLGDLEIHDEPVRIYGSRDEEDVLEL